MLWLVLQKISKASGRVSITSGLPSSKQSGLEGPRVGIIAKPNAQFVAGMWATWLCRGTAVPLALGYPESELLHVLSDAVSISGVSNATY